MLNSRLQPMGLAEAAAHVAALVALSWLVSRIRASAAMEVVEDRCGSLGGRVERAALRSAERLRREAARLGLETAALEGEAAPRPEGVR